MSRWSRRLVYDGDQRPRTFAATSLRPSRSIALIVTFRSRFVFGRGISRTVAAIDGASPCRRHHARTFTPSADNSAHTAAHDER